MKCLKHTDDDAVMMCIRCGAPMCVKCVRIFKNDALCPNCYRRACIEEKETLKYFLKIYSAFLISVGVILLLDVCLFLATGTDASILMYGLCVLGLPLLILIWRKRKKSINNFPALEVLAKIVISVWACFFGICVTPIVFIITIFKMIRIRREYKRCVFTENETASF